MELKKGYKLTEVGVIPEDWEVSTIGNLFQFKNGLNKEKSAFGQGTPIINYMDVFNNRGIQKNKIHGLVSLTSNEIKIFNAKKGDVLFTRTSETPEEIGITSVLLDEIPQLVFSGFLLRARPINNLIDDTFKKYCFSSSSARKQIISTASYTTRALTNGKNLSDIKLALPPTLAEQNAIATALNETDALIEKLEVLIEKKKAIKQGAMQELLRPKKSWEYLSYDDIFEFLSTATYSRSQLSETGEVGYVHYGDIHTKWNYSLDLKRESLPSIAKNMVKNYNFLQDGDLIMADASEDYTGIGKSIEIKNIENREIISGLHTLFLRDRNKILADGFRGYIHAIQIVKEQFNNLATGMKVYGVSKSNLKTVRIPVPPIHEQNEIATILSDMDAEIESLEAKLSKYKLVKLGMMQELLTGKTRLI